MSGAGRPPGTRSRPPGAIGLGSASFLEESSRYYPNVLSQSSDTLAVCAHIYFPTNGFRLSADDRGALYKVLKDIRAFLVNGCTVEIQCNGHADVRGESGFNKDLSARRLAEVERLLREGLRHLKGWKLRPGVPKGEEKSYDSPLAWVRDRRVDVLGRVETEAEREARNNPWVKTRAEIFRRYSPLYHLWPEAGLDYLIDMYEQHDQKDYPVTIREDDLEKVYELSLAITHPSEQGFLVQWAQSNDRAAVITDWYCVEYHKAYDDALKRYANPEYGSLDPKP